MRGPRSRRSSLALVTALALGAAAAAPACSSDGETVGGGHARPAAGDTGLTTSTTTTSTSTCVPAAPIAECQDDADCDDGDPTTVDHCQSQAAKEFPVGTCLHDACDGGPDCATQAVDTTCDTDHDTVVYPPFVALHAPDVPASCASGFEAGDAKANGDATYVLGSTSEAGSRAITLDLDFATYTAPDGLQITGVDAQCKQYVLFDSCRLKTADQSETHYTDGKHRPSDEAIRQYHLKVRKGTRQLTFDFSRVTTPMYLRVLGLCDFDVPTPPKSAFGWWAPVE